jgi:hypothetical protein
MLPISSRAIVFAVSTICKVLICRRKRGFSVYICIINKYFSSLYNSLCNVFIVIVVLSRFVHM